MIDDGAPRRGALDQLMKMLASLPGLGQRSARRITLFMLRKRHAVMVPLAKMMLQAAEDIKECDICGNLDVHNPCGVCQSAKRDNSSICVVAQVSDLWAIERTKSFRGTYHVLGGLLSALDGVGPQDLSIEGLLHRAADPNVKEIILALSATVEGQSTSHYLADHLEREDLLITRLAHGVPVGGELDYLDDGTITTALKSRRI